LLTKDAVNRQGEGVSYAFSIDRSDRYNINRIYFDYEVKSGTFEYGDGTIADPSDVRVFIYDVTNAVLIEPTNTFLDGSGKFFSEFQATDSQSYRLILHVASTNAAAWTIAFDAFSVGPRELARGPIMQKIGETNSGLILAWTASSENGEFWREGEFLVGEIKATFSAFSGNPYFQLPFNLQMRTDTPAYSPSGGGTDDLVHNCRVTFRDVSAGAGGMFLGTLQRKQQNQIWLMTESGSPLVRGFASSTLPFTWASGDTATITFKVPIQGWESNTTLSSDSGLSLVSAKIGLSANQTISTTSNTTIAFDTIRFDRGGIFSLANNGFLIRESGTYDEKVLSYVTGMTALDNTSIKIAVNGITVYEMFYPLASTIGSYQVDGPLELKAGDIVTATIDSSVDASYTLDSNDNRTFFSLQKRQSPQTLGMADKLYARYTTNSGASLANSSFNKITYEDLVEDTHGSYSGGTFTAKQRCLIQVTASLLYAQTTGWTLGATRQLSVDKNGVAYAVLDYMEESSSDSSAVNYYGKRMQGTTLVEMNVGDTLEIYERHVTGGALNIYSSDSLYNYVEFLKVG
jgi:hypothetical protein